MLARALSMLVPASLLLGYSLVLFQRRLRCSALQLFGAAALMIMVLTHVCEALHLFPGMGWGTEHSAGHYLDLICAVLGVTLFPAAHILRYAVKRSA
jgi:hypothetical protein